MQSPNRPRRQAPRQSSEPQDHYSSLYGEFRWALPEDFNIAELCCRRWASDPDRIAILFDDEAGGDRRWAWCGGRVSPS